SRDSKAAKAFRKLDEMARASFRPEGPGHGKGGTGEGGGKDGGKGTGTGPGTGPGDSGKLTQREKRMLRWTMRFTTNNGLDYLNQLAGVGAILAVPVAEPPAVPRPEYQIVRDLRPGRGELRTEDLSKIQRIYWVDDNPGSVSEVMRTLGIRLRPSHFVAFM